MPCSNCPSIDQACFVDSDRTSQRLPTAVASAPARAFASPAVADTSFG